MNWEELGKHIASEAPYLGAALGGPIGGVAGAFISEAFGAKTADPDQLHNIITGDPDHDIKLKQVEVDFQKYMASLVLQKEQLTVQDRASARQRESDIAKSGQPADHTPRNIAYIVTFGFLGCLFMLFFSQVNLNQTEKEIISLMIGALMSDFKSVMGYYFGGNPN